MGNCNCFGHPLVDARELLVLPPLLHVLSSSLVCGGKAIMVESCVSGSFLTSTAAGGAFSSALLWELVFSGLTSLASSIVVGV